MAKAPKGTSERRSNVRHGKQRRSSAVRNVAKGILTSALVLGISAVSIGAYAAWDISTRLKPTVNLGNDVPDGAQISAKEGELNILLAGTDSREGQSIDDGEEGELTDVLLLLHVSADHKNATVISFPRDLMVPIPNCPIEDTEDEYYDSMSEQQINSAISYGGLPCTVRTVEELTGIDIPYAGLISFDGVIAMSNAVGGVDVCLTQPIVDPNTDLDLPAGDITLKGVEALQFLRTRYGVGNGGDTSRISNQQVFMSAMVRKIKDADTLSNPMKVYQLAKATAENVTLTEGLNSVPVLQQIAGAIKDIDLDRINFVQYPSGTHPYQSGRLTPDYASAQIMLDVIKAGERFEVGGTGAAAELKDGETIEATAPEGEEAPPVEGEVPAEDVPSETPEGTTPAPGAETPKPGPTQLSDNVTGQSAATVTCSAGRTQY
ncbi:LCP family protein [Leucobacter sp. M11]|uniref:LCP family protein n=1 Tax=Leucobacter sp. M11 TaxID=2993565 RepID=UPI002D7F5475|nr:LCP family protein [Leucobacter sp. M11]MEB4614720.1 LCP family protein [Leucobacter sp. M11]